MANKSIFDAFERMWQHVVARFGNYATSESFNSHVDNKSNPHEVTKEQVGLGNVDNTADAAKAVLSATKATQDANGNNIAATYETKSEAESKLAESKAYSDAAAAAVKNDLLNGAGEAYDTLIELGELIDENHDAINALEIVATSKADKSDIVQSDWEQNDETALDYIKNRTHYVDVATEVLLAERAVEEVTAQIGELDGVAFWTGTQTFIYNTLIITFDGIKYQLDAFTYDSRPYWGDSRLIGETNNISDVPFLIETGYGYAEGTFFGEEIPVWNVSLNDSIAGTPHTIKIEFENGIQYHTLDEKYIPDTIARISNIPEGLPSYTSEDEGKILRIVNGVPTWVSLPNAEEASF